MASTENAPKRSAEVIFENNILPARTRATITRAIVWQLGTLLAFSLTRSLLLLEPFSAGGPGFPIGWVKNGVNMIIYPSSWFYDGLIVGCFLLLGMLYARNFQTSSNLQQLSGSGSLKVILSSVLTATTSNGVMNGLSSLLAHVTISAFLLRCYVGILGPTSISSLTTLCNLEKGDNVCVNESHVFMILSGAYTGLLVWWKLHGPSNGNALRFPLIQLSGNALLRQRIFSELTKEIFEIGLSLRWFCVLYYLIGQRVELFFADMLHVDHRIDYQGETSPMTQLLSYREMIWYFTTLILHTWAINALLIFNIFVLNTIFNINMTKRIHFPITAMESSESSCITLMDAMKNDGLKSSLKESSLLLKHLAFQDFAEITAALSPIRRSEFFNLSQPGGHPHNWNEVCSICLGAIAQFSEDLVLASKPNAAKLNEQSSKLNNIGVSETPTMPRLRRLGGTLTPSMEVRGAMSNMSSGVQELVPSRMQKLHQGENKRNSVQIQETTVFNKIEKYITGPEKIAVALSNASSVFSNPSGYTSSDASIRLVYARSQLVIWAVEGLAHLVSASITEDRYGVVQKDLPKVLEALLLLQRTVEKHRKGGTATARKNRFETRDLQLKQELRVALKSSLFRISVSFGEHLDALPLSTDLRQKLSNYQSFAEA